MIQQIKEDIKQAMKNKEKTKLSTLRMLLATIENERSKQGLKDVLDFTEDQLIELINRNIKQLNQEIDSLVNVGRDAVNQLEQKEVLTSYLPKQLTDKEILDIVQEVVMLFPNIGLVMKELSTRLKGKVDMSKVSKLVKETFNK